MKQYHAKNKITPTEKYIQFKKNVSNTLKSLGDKHPSKSIEARRRNSETNTKRCNTKEGMEHILDLAKKCYKGGDDYSKVRRYCRRKGLGFEMLNKPFPGCEEHHINHDQIIFCPKEMHKGIPHSLKDENSMIDINEKVLEWYIFDMPRELI